MRLVLLTLVSFAPLALHCQTIYSENFDSMAVGTKIAAADTSHWTTWGHMPGSSQDAPVTDTYSSSPEHSLAVIQEILGSSGGPSDPVLLLGYHISGTYSLSWRMYVPEQRGAQIVIYHENDIPSTDPSALIEFLPYYDVDSMDCYVDGAVIRRSYPRATWFTASFIFDLDGRTATFRINNTDAAIWAFDTTPSGDPANNVLGLVRFMGTSGFSGFLGEYYIDDILFQEGSVGIAEVETPRPLSIFPNPTAGGAELTVAMPLSNAQVEVHDASGRVVFHMPWATGQTRLSLPAGALAPGAYVVRVSHAGSAATALGHQGPGAESLMEQYTGRLVVMP